ncbi:MAG: 2,5-diamino-6-ribosylamino-pyrimidinone 5-phosphate reductase homolog, partial [uncultured Nocardioidaceae bacterium]
AGARRRGHRPYVGDDPRRRAPDGGVHRHDLAVAARQHGVLPRRCRDRSRRPDGIAEQRRRPAGVRPPPWDRGRGARRRGYRSQRGLRPRRRADRRREPQRPGARAAARWAGRSGPAGDHRASAGARRGPHAARRRARPRGRRGGGRPDPGGRPASGPGDEQASGRGRSDPAPRPAGRGARRRALPDDRPLPGGRRAPAGHHWCTRRRTPAARAAARAGRHPPRPLARRAL